MMRYLILASLLMTVAGAPSTRFSDHGDTPLLTGVARHDARITDLYAFERDGNLVIALCLDPTVAPGVTSYGFASDLEVSIFVDNDSAVGFDDPDDVADYGGTLTTPGGVQEDIGFRITFKKGQPKLQTVGLPASAESQIELFAGLRDDPFIRGPRIGRNVAALVLEMPLSLVVHDQPTLLLWATSKVPGLAGPFQDLAGRSLRSMFPENDAMNQLKPKQHHNVLGLVPDVVIYDTSLPAAYPNGRELADDVVDLVGDARILMNDQPFPTTNDVPFLGVFPYLAAPQ